MVMKVKCPLELIDICIALALAQYVALDYFINLIKKISGLGLELCVNLKKS